MHVFTKLHVVYARPDRMQRPRPERSTREAAETEGWATHLICKIHRLDDVGRVSAPGDGDDEIALHRDVRQLLG